MSFQIPGKNQADEALPAAAPKRAPPCAYYPKGNCKNGTTCPFSHVGPLVASRPPSPWGSGHGTPVCFYFHKGTCANGIKCPYLHVDTASTSGPVSSISPPVEVPQTTTNASRQQQDKTPGNSSRSKPGELDKRPKSDGSSRNPGKGRKGFDTIIADRDKRGGKRIPAVRTNPPRHSQIPPHVSAPPSNSELLDLARATAASAISMVEAVPATATTVPMPSSNSLHPRFYRPPMLPLHNPPPLPTAAYDSVPPRIPFRPIPPVVEVPAPAAPHLPTAAATRSVDASKPSGLGSEIELLLESRQFDDAFTKALLSGDPSLVNTICQQVAPPELSVTSSSLEPGPIQFRESVLLLIMRQLSVDMAVRSPALLQRQLEWIEFVCKSLEPETSQNTGKMVEILHEVNNAIKRVRNDRGNDQAVVHMAVKTGCIVTSLYGRLSNWERDDVIDEDGF